MKVTPEQDALYAQTNRDRAITELCETLTRLLQPCIPLAEAAIEEAKADIANRALATGRGRRG